MIVLPARVLPARRIRPLNLLHDLPQVADLIEVCFAPNMDEEGQSYVQQMRRAGQESGFLRWANSTSLPLSGFVWEEEGQIIGNVSIVHHRHKRKKLALLANIATHPDHRRRGIARALTEHAMRHAHSKGAQELWLNVREDNPAAIRLYTELGFVERARHTIYQALPDPLLPPTREGVQVGRPAAGDWPLQQQWLSRAYPLELVWYYRVSWSLLAPGLRSWFYRLLFVEADVRQWAARQDGKLLAVLSWLPAMEAARALWVAAPRRGEAAGLRSVLEAARRELIRQPRLTVEYPAGEMGAAFQAAGFLPQRTLLWMRAEAATA